MKVSIKTNSEIRALARQALAGKWNTAALATLLSGLAYLFLALLDKGAGYLLEFPSIVLICGLGFIVYGMQRYFLRISRNTPCKPTDVYYGIVALPRGIFFLSIALYGLYLFAIIVPTLLVVGILSLFDSMVATGNVEVPKWLCVGVVVLAGSWLVIRFSIAFAMAYYLLIEEGPIGPINILRKSSALMKGHQVQYFTLQLSFLGWAALSILTLGIGALWFAPYSMVSSAIFFDEVANQQRESTASSAFG